VPWSPASAVRRREIIAPPRATEIAHRPIRSETRARLVEGIAKGRLWLEELVSGRVSSTKEIAAREGCSDRPGSRQLDQLRHAATFGQPPVHSGLNNLRA
jgi:site-specific DNA recombinase